MPITNNKRHTGVVLMVLQRLKYDPNLKVTLCLRLIAQTDQFRLHVQKSCFLMVNY